MCINMIIIFDMDSTQDKVYLKVKKSLKNTKKKINYLTTSNFLTKGDYNMYIDTHGLQSVEDPLGRSVGCPPRTHIAGPDCHMLDPHDL